MNLTLYEIGESLEDVIADLSLCDDAESEALLAELDALLDARDDKIKAYVHIIRNAEAGAKMLRTEAQVFSKRAQAQENLASRLKNRLMQDLQNTGESSLRAGPFNIRRQQSPPQRRAGCRCDVVA